MGYSCARPGMHQRRSRRWTGPCTRRTVHDRGLRLGCQSFPRRPRRDCTRSLCCKCISVAGYAGRHIVAGLSLRDAAASLHPQLRGSFNDVTEVHDLQFSHLSSLLSLSPVSRSPAPRAGKCRAGTCLFACHDRSTSELAGPGSIARDALGAP